MVVLFIGFEELVICPHPLDLAGGQGRAKAYLKESSLEGRKQKGRCSSVRSGNEKDENKKGWEKSSQTRLVENLFVKEPSQYLTCLEKA